MKITSYRRRKINKQLKEIKYAIGVTLDRKLDDVCNEKERELSTTAHTALCMLYNSLHRYLIET